MIKKPEEPHSLSWGDFPAKQIEEVLLEEELGEPYIKKGKSLSNLSLTEIRKESLLLKEEINSGNRTSLATLYGLCSGLIVHRNKNTNIRDVAFNFLSKNHILKRIPARIGFILAIQCIRNNFTDGLKKLVIGIRNASLNPDISIYQNDKGQCLGHLAAICNRYEIIQFLSKTNREALTDNEGNNVCHTASKFGALESIDILLNNSKRLFGKRNNSGETPLDLASGGYICEKVAVQSIFDDIELGEKRHKASLEKILAAKKLPISLPFVKIGKPSWNTEVISGTDPLFELHEVI